MRFCSRIKLKPDWAKDVEEGEEGANNGEQEGDGVVVGGAQHVLLLVDCSSEMFVNSASSTTTTITTTTPMDLSLYVAETMLKELIHQTVTRKTGKRDGVGLLLYNTKRRRPEKQSSGQEHETNTNRQQQQQHFERTNEPMEEEEEEDDEKEDDEEEETGGSTVHVLLPLAPPGVNQVKTIQACLEEETHLGRTDAGTARRIRTRTRDLQADYGAPKEEEQDCETTLSSSSSRIIAPLQKALEESLRIYQSAKCVKQTQKLKPNEPADTKSIWIFTNRENPYPDVAQQELIKNVAADAKEQGIQIIIWPLPDATSFTFHSQNDEEEEEEQSHAFDHSHFFESLATKVVFPFRLLYREALDEALEHLRNEWKKIRRAYYCPLLLPDWKEQQQHHRQANNKTNSAKDDNASKDNRRPPNIMIDWYRIVKPITKPSTLTIHQETKRYVSKEKYRICHGRLLLNKEGTLLLVALSVWNNLLFFVPTIRFLFFPLESPSRWCILSTARRATFLQPRKKTCINPSQD
jgi:hypothetical protein